MTAILKSSGLQHAYSLGNIELSAKHGTSRSYDSEDENMSRKHSRFGSSLHLRSSTYSRTDIQEQYCLSERQRSRVKRSKLEGFFGCVSSHSNNQNFFGFCVGHGSSDENIASSAPFHRERAHPRSNGIICSEDDIENSYFRRRPTSFLRSNDPKRFAWMANEEKQCAQRVRSCSAYVGGTSKTPPPSALSSGDTHSAPRTKHVSFARSHTLTSFDEMSFGRSPSRITSAKSQERLIGGLKATNSPEPVQHHHLHHTQHRVHDTQQLPSASSITPMTDTQCTQPTDTISIEKFKRSSMKVQATQTDCYPVRKFSTSSRMSLSPRNASRAHVAIEVDQFATDGRGFPKSLSEALNHRCEHMMSDNVVPNADDILQGYQYRSPVHRTQSEEPPRSPREVFHQLPNKASFDSKYGQEAMRQQLLCVSQASTISGYSTEHTKTSVDSTAYSMADNYSNSNHVNYNECIDFMERAIQYPFESHSLPRRKCSHHANEYQTNSLPRNERKSSQESNGSGKPLLGQIQAHGTFSMESKMGSNQNLADPLLRRYSCGVHDMMAHLNHTDFEAMTSILRRNSMDACYYARKHPYGSEDEEDEEEDDGEEEEDEYEEEEEDDDDEEDDPDCECCSSYESVSDSQAEKEIFIDFKPSIPLLQNRSKRLQKTLSEGEILIEKRSDTTLRKEKLLAAASEGEIKQHESMATVVYSNLPIKDEGICTNNNHNLLRLPAEHDYNTINRREAFHKRSMSLDEQGIEDRCVAGDTKCTDGKDKNISSTYPSSDSLANDLTRDHSDGIWNESQATVLHLSDHMSPDKKTLQPSPNSKRKILLIQHQQRSSMDTDALDFEEPAIEKSITQPPPTVAPSTTKMSASTPNSSKSIKIINSPLKSVNAPTISVIPSQSMEADYDIQQRKAIITAHTDIRRRSIDTSSHIYANTAELMRNCSIAKSSSDQQPFVKQYESIRADVSEGSTNTDEYVTCTDASKRGTLTANATSITQPPPEKFATTQNSQTLTQNGSSFESASSVYSLARVENICEDAAPTIIEDTLPLPKAPSTKPSPSHSISSSSSGSYFSGKKPISTSPRNSIVQAQIYAPNKPNTESISDDEKSEKRYSSSGYYESPHNDDSEFCRPRRHRDMAEEERRRRKEKLRLDIEHDNVDSLTSPTNKQCTSFKRISPNDKTALQILDGGTQAKTKRIRPKTRRSPRARTLNEEPTFLRRSDAVSPEKVDTESLHRRKPSKCIASGSVAIGKRTENRLNALSAESIRSVSPGSDSVFYSEVDVHCHHCGKEVEIVTAIGDNDEGLLMHDDNHINIVKPPADFADSPNGPRHTQRLYKKMDKRYRSEERHGERRIYRTRQENARAKSEERGNGATKEQSLRAAGSSPCVVVGSGSFNARDSVPDPDEGIYHGFYRLGSWICVSDRDVWHRQDLDSHDTDRPKDPNQRRPSTESEKDFHKKYQAITHRLVHRKSCVEMYRRKVNNSFCTDKTIVVRRESGEFGFRIHGSKPVVVSAIEPETPAESSGLEIGDIVLSVNGVSVIDKSHSEVVKLAHAGSDVLELEVARTIGILSNETLDATSPSLYSCYLWRQTHVAQTNTHKWVRRWFCLRTDHCLYYYKTEQDSQPVGALLLTNHNIENCSPDIGRPFAFRITSNDGPPLNLAADNEETTNRWIAVLSHAAKQCDPWLETSTRNLRIPPASVPRPDCSGFLLKLGHRWRAWSKRHCVLKDACLYFYLDGSSKNALGMACLQGYKVQAANNTHGKKYVFEIIPPEPKLRHYYFSSDSDMDKKRWIAALEYSIDRWMKS